MQGIGKILPFGLGLFFAPTSYIDKPHDNETFYDLDLRQLYQGKVGQPLKRLQASLGFAVELSSTS